MKASQWILLYGIFLGGLLTMVGSSGCKHLPNMTYEPFMPIDTTDNPIDTTGTDTTGMGTPCDPDLIYFERDILPILISNCTTSDCHNAQDAQDDVILDSYQNTIQTADVRPFDLSGSDLYEVITEDDPDKIMPRPPRAPLTNGQISLIAEWILQGAQNLTCDEDAGECNTENVSYSMTILPIINTSCRGCHSGANPNGGIDLTTYPNIRAQALNGNLYGVTERLPGFVPMPFNGNKLPQCQVDQIQAWVDNGAPQN